MIPNISFLFLPLALGRIIGEALGRRSRTTAIILSISSFTITIAHIYLIRHFIKGFETWEPEMIILANASPFWGCCIAIVEILLFFLLLSAEYDLRVPSITAFILFAFAIDLFFLVISSCAGYIFSRAESLYFFMGLGFGPLRARRDP